jgi:hypothetical protein
MTEPLGIGPLQHRRGVGPVNLLIWIVLAAVGGAITWGMYGNDIRSVLKLPPAGAPEHWVNTRTEQNSKGINVDEIVGLVKDLQVSQQHTADDVRTALQLLTAEQAATKTLSDAVAALQAKVDSLQRPVAPPAPKKLVPSATRKPSAPSPPPSTSPDQDQPEPEPGAPVGPERR